jgi:hypothetical protein
MVISPIRYDDLIGSMLQAPPLGPVALPRADGDVRAANILLVSRSLEDRCNGSCPMRKLACAIAALVGAVAEPIIFRFVVAALAASAALLPLGVSAQAPSDNAPPPYHPSLADLMTTTVQPRHVKLAFAGREKNWVFAAYELKQLTDAFDRLSLQWPQWRRQPIVELVETIARDPLFELDNAIKNRNGAEFAKAYDHLTDACNACHQAALQTPVVIQDPKEAMFPDQDFRPKE